MPGHIPAGELDIYLVLSGELPAEPADGGLDSQRLQLRRMELVRQGLNVTRNLGTMFTDFLQPVFGSLW